MPFPFMDARLHKLAHSVRPTALQINSSIAVLPEELLLMVAIVSHFSTFKHALASPLYRFLLFQANPFCVQLGYFASWSVAGFLLLKLLPMRDHATARPPDVDLLFMSVSANTVSSLDTVEMEDFSDLQLASLTLLMAAGAEIFVSLLGLYFAKARSSQMKKGSSSDRLGNGGRAFLSSAEQEDDLALRSVKRLFFVVLGYLLVSHVAGFLLVLLYLSAARGAAGVLASKGLSATVFSVFTTVSSLANCGFLPTNENMVAFRTSPGLLLIVAAQVLAGSTMYASSLRAVVWALRKATGRPEYEYLLNKSGEVGGFEHLVPGREAVSLALTVAALVAVQFLLFCGMEWSSGVLSGLSPYQKIVSAAFMSVNSRYGGENTVDLSAVAPAILVLFIVMMYLPPYTCLIPGEKNSNKTQEDKKEGKSRLGFIFSPLGYIAIFTIIACITERRQISEDPLNFSILNIVFEIVSAYRTVGYSTGYSCKRRLKAELEEPCREVSAGFAARWSNAGKLLLIGVMLLGRLKKFEKWQILLLPPGSLLARSHSSR